MPGKLTLWGAAFIAVAAGASRMGSFLAPTDAQASVPAPVRREPPFNFRTLKIGTQLAVARKSVGFDRCWPGGGDTTTCELKSWTLGSVPLIESYVSFAKSGFTGLILVTRSDDFDQTMGEVVEAYGPPCDATTRKLQNLMGATFSGDTLTWCFADGYMTLERHDKSDVRHSVLQFYVPAAPEPPKHYNPSTL